MYLHLHHDYMVSLSLLYMLDVIHLITVLSDRPSFEWECNVTGRPIWFHPVKLTFSTCFRVFVAQQWHGAMLFGGLAKGQWAVLRMTTEGGDWVVLTSHFYRSYKVLWKSISTLCRLCDLYCGPLLSWKNAEKFSCDNMGPLRNYFNPKSKLCSLRTGFL